MDRCPRWARAVVDHPEDPFGRGVGIGPHDLFDQAPEGDDAGGVVAAAHHLAPAHVPGSQIGHRRCVGTRARPASGGLDREAGWDGSGNGPGCWSSRRRRPRARPAPTVGPRTPGHTGPTPSPPLAPKSGSRGKIHDRCSHGRIASPPKILPTVDAEMVSPPYVSPAPGPAPNSSTATTAPRWWQAAHRPAV